MSDDTKDQDAQAPEQQPAPTPDVPWASAPAAPVADAPAAPVSDAPAAETPAPAAPVAPVAPTASDEVALAQGDTPASQPVNPENVGLTTAPVPPVVDVPDTAATASQPPAATVVSEGIGATPEVVQAAQPETVPDPDVNAEEGAEVPNPNLNTTLNHDVPAPINPDATGPTPAPITHEEATAHIAIQQEAAEQAASATTTQLDGQATADTAEHDLTTHEGVLGHLMKELEGVAAMGKSEIIALIAAARARFEEL
jgi:nicotinate-nucleotide--dimethylbenzimidazole phosphoribosyltransferase